MVLGFISPFPKTTFRLKRVNNENTCTSVIIRKKLKIGRALHFTQTIVRLGLNIGQNMPSGMGRYHEIS